MMHLYSVFCIVVHPKRFTIMGGGVSPQPPPVCSIHLNDAMETTVQGASALTIHQLQVEWRESLRANQVVGDY